jgi:hypothetical protein
MVNHANGKKCGAVIVGINEYQDRNIQSLRGAQIDAAEIYEKLKASNFRILEEHFLLGEDATYLKIRNALNDILWIPNGYDLILFYLSGNIYIDKYGKFYIVPYDMTTESPFLRGLRMGELGDVIYQSPNTTPIVIVLDCCYSGVNEEDPGSLFYSKEKFEKDIGSRTQSSLLFLSCNARPNSKEILNSTHPTNNRPHPHGILSLHFIKRIDNSQESISIYNIVQSISEEATAQPIFYRQP